MKKFSVQVWSKILDYELVLEYTILKKIGLIRIAFQGLVLMVTGNQEHGMDRKVVCAGDVQISDLA